MMIKAMRTAHGWSQTELAERAGLEQTTISRAEKGFEGTTLRVLKSIAAALDTNVVDLLGEERPLAEQRLLLAFRSLPKGQQLGWIQLAEAISTSVE